LTFSYTLLLALILLFPGLCAWAALRTVERTDLLTPRPDKSNSTATLFVIVLGTIIGHMAGSFVFVLQGLWCRVTGVCLTVAFDPNVYRIVFTGAGTRPGPSRIWRSPPGSPNSRWSVSLPAGWSAPGKRR
jgi:hypothetical protein